MSLQDIVIAALVGGLGANVIAELIKSQRIELQEKSEHRKWAREKKLALYQDLSIFIKSIGYVYKSKDEIKTINFIQANMLLGKAMLFISDKDLIKKIEKLFMDIQDLQRLYENSAKKDKILKLISKIHLEGVIAINELRKDI